MVEGRHIHEAGGRRVPGRPKVGAAESRRLHQFSSGLIPQEVGAGGPEAHHRHVGAAPRHAQPLDGVVETEPEDDEAAPAPEFPVPELAAPELPVPELPAPELPAPEVPAPGAADTAGTAAGTLADALRTSDGFGESGVRTEAFTGTHTPYCGFTLTEEWCSREARCFWVVVAPACWTAFSTAVFALLYAVGVREVISSKTYVPLSSTGAETTPVARLLRPAAGGSLVTRSDSTSQPSAPPPLALVPAATVANGVPEATWAAPACAALSLEKTAAVRQAVSNCRAVRREVVLQVGVARADAGQVLLQCAGLGHELHLLVDERGRHGVQDLLPGQRLAREAAAVADVLALWCLQDLGHDLRDLPGQV